MNIWTARCASARPLETKTKKSNAKAWCSLRIFADLTLHQQRLRCLTKHSYQIFVQVKRFASLTLDETTRVTECLSQSTQTTHKAPRAPSHVRTARILQCVYSNRGHVTKFSTN